MNIFLLKKKWRFLPIESTHLLKLKSTIRLISMHMVVNKNESGRKDVSEAFATVSLGPWSCLFGRLFLVI